MTPIHNPLISVIIAVWNGRATIGRCLDAVRAQSLPSEELEIIVVDNGSTDGTAEIARSVPGVIVLTEHRPGSYAARSEEHTSELQSLMRNSYAVFCLKKKKTKNQI